MTPTASTQHASNPAVVLTGATGMIGHAVLANLLIGSKRVVCLIRNNRGLANAASDPLLRLSRLLAPLGVDAQKAHDEGRLVIVPFDLTDGDSPLEASAIPLGCAFVHAAADTRFNETPDGSLHRSNVEGTRSILRIAERFQAERFVLVSTAFVCGCGDDIAREQVGWTNSSNNDYERTKRESELLAASFERRTGVPVAIIRPSIVVGDWSTGRSTKFAGFYLSVRAAAMLARSTPSHERLSIPLRMLGRPEDDQNIVSLDYVASAITHATTCASPRSIVANLTHPNPPTNEQIQRAIEVHFGIAGGCFVPPEEFSSLDLSMLERQFLVSQEPIRPYIERPPRFERANADLLDAERGASCPRWDEASLFRLFSFAEEHNFGRQLKPARERRGARCAEYFEDYLPSVLADRALPGGESVNAVVRFVVRDVPRGAWLCVFEQGRLAKVSRTTNGAAEDIRYETDERAFWRVVTGAETPQDVFLRGEAEIFGDLERALMMGTLLRRFNELHPVRSEQTGARKA